MEELATRGQHRVGDAPGCWQGGSGAVEDGVGGDDVLGLRVVHRPAAREAQSA